MQAKGLGTEDAICFSYVQPPKGQILGTGCLPRLLLQFVTVTFLSNMLAPTLGHIPRIGGGTVSKVLGCNPRYLPLIVVEVQKLIVWA